MKTFCSYYNSKTCLSCDLIEKDYTDQIAIKEARLNKIELLPTVTSNPFGFRNKAKISVTGTIENPILGLIGTDDLDSGRELLSCPLHHLEINKIFNELKTFITLAKLSPYQIKKQTGELKGIIIFHSEKTDETYIRFILRSKESIDRIKKNLSTLLANYSSLKCVSANIQPIPHAILEGEEEVFLTDRHFINHQIGSFNFKISPKAFIQTNSAVAEKLYETASRWISEVKTERFSELFCGQGNFSFLASKNISEGLGIEINEDAVIKANEMAKEYGLTKLKFKASDAQKILDDVIEFNPDTILVNPPRRGLAKTVDLLLKIKVKNLFYSSCNAETLLTDLEKLDEFYEVVRGQVFDMFPQTSHFEILVELRLKKLIHNL